MLNIKPYLTQLIAVLLLLVLLGAGLFSREYYLSSVKPTDFLVGPTVTYVVDDVTCYAWILPEDLIYSQCSNGKSSVENTADAFKVDEVKIICEELLSKRDSSFEFEFLKELKE